MATGNFKSMSDFPLIVAEDIYEKICPECHCGCGGDTCDSCGHDLTDVEAVYDQVAMQERIDDMQKVADRINEMGHVSDFFDVTVESGYYSGVQFYVEDKTWKIEDIDNEDAQCTYGCCRSEALRRYKVAGNTIRRELQKAKKGLCLMELGVVARFSNGETIYEKVA